MCPAGLYADRAPVRESRPSSETSKCYMHMPPSSPPQRDHNSIKNSKKSSLVTQYRASLTALSRRTGTALPSLITSFAVLHEVTAIVPLVGVFYACKSFGIGERVVEYARERNSEQDGTWIGHISDRWMKEGEKWAGRVGRRYGIWGFEKGSKDTDSESSSLLPNTRVIAGDVANALVAYCTTKALLPARVGVALYLSPAFSRRVVDPVRRRVVEVFRNK